MLVVIVARDEDEAIAVSLALKIGADAYAAMGTLVVALHVVS